VKCRRPGGGARWVRYGILTAGTAHAIVLCAAIPRYTPSPAQATPGSQRTGASPQVAGSRLAMPASQGGPAAFPFR